MRRLIGSKAILGAVLAAAWVSVALGQPNSSELPTPNQEREVPKGQLLPAPTPVPPPPLPAPAQPLDVLEGPMTSLGNEPIKLPVPSPDPNDTPLPINLATALRLADARPLLIAAASAQVQIAAARLEAARVLWLPNLYFGADYVRHDGGFQSFLTGNAVINSRQGLMVGPGFSATFALTDALYTPLVAQQVLRARQADVQTAKNDALFQTAQAYFNVMQTLGQYAGAMDAADKSRQLVRVTQGLARGLTAPIEIERTRTLQYNLEQVVIRRREEWRVASAELARVLRLNPGAIAVPLEPPHLAVTLISPNRLVDDLIPIGLTARPELATQQAFVQATLVRLRQERMRPLIPSLVFQGNANAGAGGPPIAGGLFVAGPGPALDFSTGRMDLNASALWELRGLGFGNQALIRERRGENQLAMVELYRVQDLVAAEIAQAHANLESAAGRVAKAENELKTGLLTFAGNIRGLKETTRFGDILKLVNTPQEAVSALQQLELAYNDYYTTVADYNRAQFRLFRAMGFPAEILACERPVGPIQPVNTDRIPPLPPVIAPEPCANGKCVPPAPPTPIGPPVDPASLAPPPPIPINRNANGM